MSRELDIPTTIETARFRLTRLTADDRDELFEHFGDPAVTDFLDFERLSARSETDAIVTWADGLFDSGKGVRWTIRDGDGAFLGTCGFNSIVTTRASYGEVAYDLRPASWGRGVMREVMETVLRIGFAHLDLRRLQAFVTPGNDRSCRLLERLGFRREGTLRDYGFWRGRFWDQLLYSLLQSDWRDARRTR